MINLIKEGLISKLDSTRRFNGHFTLHEESVATHSFWVVFYANLLFRNLFAMASWERTDENNDWISLYYWMFNFTMRQAIMHDVDEIFTSDVLYRTKYHGEGGDDVRRGLRKIVLDDLAKLPDGIFKTELQASMTSDGVSGTAEQLTIEQKTVCHNIVKLCDWVSSYHYSWQEVQCGNPTFVPILKTCVEGLRTCVAALAVALENSHIPYSASVLETIL